MICVTARALYMVMHGLWDWDRKWWRDESWGVNGRQATKVQKWRAVVNRSRKARSPTVDSRVRPTNSDEDEAERSRWRASTSATWHSSSTRYDGADPWMHLYTRTAHLKAIRFEAFSQWSWRRSGVMWSNREEEKMSRAAAFITDWNRDKMWCNTGQSCVTV